MEELAPQNPLSKRAADLRTMKPGLVAHLTLYSKEMGGKTVPAYPGWGCPCVSSADKPSQGWDAWPILENAIYPGETRSNVPFVFLTEEGESMISALDHFYLWEGKIVGEAVVISRT